MLPRAKKRFGQHFLTDESCLRAIVEVIDPQAGDVMVEIGPGTGILTARLAAVVRPLHVVEIDRDLAARLRQAYPADRVAVHEADVLEFEFTALPQPLRVVGNLPYNVSSPVLFRMAEITERLRDCVFMLQKEVVDRMVAPPDSADYGRLSVMLQYRFAMEKRLDVPPEAFTPPPKVDSAVVSMRPLPASRPRAGDEAAFAALVSAAFAQRRKTLRNATRALGVREESFAAAGIDPSRRGETLSVAEFIALCDAHARPGAIKRLEDRGAAS